MRINPEQISIRMRDLIFTFVKDQDRLTDDQIGELRATLAATSYAFVESNLKIAYNDAAKCAIAYERVKGEAYERLLHDEGITATKAGVLYRKEEDYLEALKQKELSTAILHQTKMLLSQCNQVLNAMSVRSKH